MPSSCRTSARVQCWVPLARSRTRSSRGPTHALAAEVLFRRLQCALDVVDPEPLPAGHPLWSAKDALITPHVGGNAPAFEPRILRLLKGQLEVLAAGRTPANLVQQGPF